MNSNGEVRAQFVDRYGEEREIHATRQGLTVKRRRSTVVLTLNPVVSVLVGRLITAERQRQGLTLAQLSIRAGIVSPTPKSRMWEIEKGVRREGVRFGTLYAVAAALGVEPTTLLPTTKEVFEEAGIEVTTIDALKVVAS